MSQELTTASIVVRILLSFVLGGIIGLERGLKNRPAGLRTYMLVCVGSCLIMLINHYVFFTYQIGDPVRMGAQVVSGIGFLGAGTIVVTKQNQIRGLTTAAGLWSSAAVGLALGIGFYEAACIGAFAIFMILSVLHHWDNRMHRRSRIVELYVELSDEISLGAFMALIKQDSREIKSILPESFGISEDGNRSYIATIKLARQETHDSFVSELLHQKGIACVEEL